MNFRYHFIFSANQFLLQLIILSTSRVLKILFDNLTSLTTCFSVLRTAVFHPFNQRTSYVFFLSVFLSFFLFNSYFDSFYSKFKKVIVSITSNFFLFSLKCSLCFFHTLLQLFRVFSFSNCLLKEKLMQFNVKLKFNAKGLYANKNRKF